MIRIAAALGWSAMGTNTIVSARCPPRLSILLILNPPRSIRPSQTQHQLHPTLLAVRRISRTALAGVGVVKMRADRAILLKALLGWQLVRLTAALLAGVIALAKSRVAALV
jgi:hypothetical protein